MKISTSSKRSSGERETSTIAETAPPTPTTTPDPAPLTSPVTSEAALTTETPPPKSATSASPVTSLKASSVDVGNLVAVQGALQRIGGVEREELLARFHRVHTITNLEKYRPPVFPDRPFELPRSDDEALDRIKDSKSSKGALKEHRELLQTFGSWRGGILLEEQRSEGSLIVLLSAILRFRAVGDDENEFEIRRFIGNEYRKRLGDDRPRDELDIRRLAVMWSRRYDLLSEVLRYEKPLPRNSPARRESEPEQIGAFDYA